MSRRDAVRKVLADAALWGDVDAELLDSLTEAVMLVAGIDKPLTIGDVLDDPEGAGHFDGLLGRDFYYRSLRVEALGADWVVVRDDRDSPWMIEGDPADLVKYRSNR